MKVNTTTLAKRVCQTVGEMLPDYDTACIVLRLSDDGVEASVNISKDGMEGVGEELFTTRAHPTIISAVKYLETELKARVTKMSRSVGLATPDDPPPPPWPGMKVRGPV